MDKIKKLIFDFKIKVNNEPTTYIIILYVLVAIALIK
jgi:hypothetical protein|tara:strand:- start:680 stop:790 length:111 start_codon:yes stop_codon:yes gene_type:complete